MISCRHANGTVNQMEDIRQPRGIQPSTPPYKKGIIFYRYPDVCRNTNYDGSSLSKF